MAGSQLKQLKASLKANGLLGQTNTGKKGKRPNSSHDRKDRDKAIQSIREAFNPFDVKVTKQKVDVIGRTIQGAQGKPGISKQVGEENRRRAYEVMAKKNKAGGIIDRRFGENDANMTPEEKMLARFTREKLTGLASRKESLFNLEDDDGEDDTLTHYGQSLSLTDDFEQDDLGVDEDDEETKEIIRKRRMMMVNGNEEEEGESSAPKSKKEVMQEIIAKSKMYKYERQQAKEEDLHIIDELDAQENLDELLEDLNAYDRKHTVPKAESAERDEEYEQRVREMAFDRRAQPTDRTKTEEELAKEKAEKTRKLEQDRLARMDGEIYNDDDDDIGHTSDSGSGEEDEGEGDEDVNDAAEFGLDVRNFSDDYVSDGDNIDGSDEGEFLDEDDEEAESELSQPSKRRKVSESKPQYTCPETIDDLESILNQQTSSSEYPKVIERILDLYHPSKAVGNKQKLGVFTTVLFEFLQKPNYTSNYPQVFTKMVEQLKTLTTSHVEVLTDFCREQILQVNEKLTATRLGDSTVAPADVLLFTLIGLVFSTSDHFHLVVTSATLVLAQHLSQSPLRSAKDLLTNIFICDTLLAYQRISQRYIPEIPLFLQRLLTLSTSSEGAKDVAETLDIFVEDSDFHFDLDIKALKGLDGTLKLLDFVEPRDNLLERIFLHSLDTISTASNLWRDKLAYIEIFGPITKLLEVHGDIHPLVASTRSKLEKLIAISTKERVPLTLQSHRPLPIQTFAPKFEENYNVDKKSYDPDRERNEGNKLRAELKKERKGALRDLRRDNAFIAREKIKTKRQTDKEYHEKLARLERTIQTEEGAEKNKYEREKQARKRKH
ncbi:Nop14p [Sugiyamaella lignohabitans]|uniref:Nop14p n=1 Tax=Sugiyamaella lignohabitans TaxID=796027 RepID=A0A161HG32_9ASCO|nr:Nop14p [Sugiyamaella lignohabitans]ANB14620.1 Nop14p [Sugiyamaella lignohabitans]